MEKKYNKSSCNWPKAAGPIKNSQEKKTDGFDYNQTAEGESSVHASKPGKKRTCTTKDTAKCKCVSTSINCGSDASPGGEMKRNTAWVKCAREEDKNRTRSDTEETNAFENSSTVKKKNPAQDEGDPSCVLGKESFMSRQTHH